MSKTQAHADSSSDAQPPAVTYDDDTVPDDETRNSREDAVDAKQFELLVESTYEMKDNYGLQARFLLFMCGRLGLRAGELAHFKESWVDRRRSMLCVPRFDECGKGLDGGLCGQCRSNNVQKVNLRASNQYAEAHRNLGDKVALEPGGGHAADAIVPVDEFHNGKWVAKSDAGAREIPFDSVVRADIIIDRFFERYQEWPVSQTGVNRRVDKIVAHSEGIGDPDNLYPHALRATAGTYWADHGLQAFALKQMMGWEKLSTAQRYIAASSERTAKQMRDVTI